VFIIIFIFYFCKFKAFKIDVTSDINEHANNKALMNALQIGEYLQLIQEEEKEQVKSASNLIREKSISVSIYIHFLRLVASKILICFVVVGLVI
jgi:hypothetical protein